MEPALEFWPFAEFGFMRRALVACLALSVCGAPLGTLLILRRMALVGDAMAHAILPGAAAGFLVAGLSLWAMTVGGLFAATIVAGAAGLVSRSTSQREDASFAAVYLIALASGVLLASLADSRVDLLHLLFGTVLAVDDAGLLLVAVVATLVLLAVAVFYRAIVVDSFDRRMLIAHGAAVWPHMLFVFLVVLVLVAGFQVLGTLMSVGLLILPAAASRFWSEQLAMQIGLAMLIGAGASLCGLLLSYHASLPSGPSIVLVAGGVYLVSVVGGARGGVLVRRLAARHRTA